MRSAWLTASAALVAFGCGGTPLVGGTGGSPGTGGGYPAFDGGGAGGINGALCAQAVNAYAGALSAALACTPGAADQCQVLVGTTPTECGPGSACGSQAYANDGTQIEAARGAWLSACTSGAYLGCPLVECYPPAPPSTCVPTSPGAATGLCVPNASGVAPPGGESCDQLALDYAAAVTAALACTPGAPNQCQATISPLLTACNDPCVRYLGAGDVTTVTTIWAKWAAQCIGQSACPNSGCYAPPPDVSCVPVDGGATGYCSTALLQ
jgi:hypothetical protein